jgi:2-amino-4-hydroxy-6-hydroxymethyldihydropteridine diphosphokinase
MSKKVILALGSSLGDKSSFLSDAKHYLIGLSKEDIRVSSIWETEPVGIARNQFYNAVVEISFDGSPDKLLELLKKFESDAGRDHDAPRWTDRPIDIDIIDFDRKLFLGSDLEVPHPRYHERLFVLLPLQEIAPSWVDISSGDHIDDMIKKASPIRLSKITAKW